jgi:hypothetical protein
MHIDRVSGQLQLELGRARRLRATDGDDARRRRMDRAGHHGCGVTS